MTINEYKLKAITDARRILGDNLQSGNGGSWEADNDSVKNAATVWLAVQEELDLRPSELIARFAMWVLYSYHSAQPKTQQSAPDGTKPEAIELESGETK
jgi:hypothetical protein